MPRSQAATQSWSHLGSARTSKGTRESPLFARKQIHSRKLGSLYLSALILLFVLAELSWPKLFQWTMDGLTKGHWPSFLHSQENPARDLGFLFLLVATVQMSSQILARRYSMAIGASVSMKLRSAIFRKQLYLAKRFEVGKWISNFHSDTSQIAAGPSSLLFQFLYSAFAFLAVIALASLIDIKTAMIMAFFCLIGASAQKLLSQDQKKLRGNAEEAHKTFVDHFESLTLSQRFIRYNQLTESFALKAKERSQALYSSGIAIEGKRIESEFVQGLLSMASLLAVAIAGLQSVQSTQISSGEFLALFFYTLMLFPISDELLSTIIGTRHYQNARERLSPTLQLKKVTPSQSKKAFSQQGSSLPLFIGWEKDEEKRQFLLPNGKLESMNLKSAEFHQLQSTFNTPVSKDLFIAVFGHPLESLSDANRSRMLHVLDSKSKMFSGSILENLLMGQDAELGQVWQTLRICGMAQRIDQLEGGLEGKVYQNGFPFSGGEKARLLIARALLSHAPLLVFFDAFCGIEAQGRKKILRNLSVNAANKSILNIELEKSVSG